MDKWGNFYSMLRKVSLTCYKVNKLTLCILFSLLFIISLTSCKNKINNNDLFIDIKGNLKNLPDGKIYLVNIYNRSKAIDSSTIREGKFSFKLKIKRSEQFSFVTLIAKDNADSTREFLYPSNKLHNGQPMFDDHFILEDDITLNGKLSDFKPKSFKIPGKMKMVKLNQPILAKQSWVLYNITPIFPRYNNDSNFNELKKVINRFSYSYYLLNEINQNVTLLNEVQLKEVLNLFNNEIKQTPMWIELNKINEKFTKNKTSLEGFKLLNSDGKRETIINNQEKKVTIIIFWASWCLPCIEEIPSFKKFYALNKNVDIVSISLDNDKNNWEAALNKYKMPWTQLWCETASEKKQLLYYFKLTGSIPATVILDNRGVVKQKNVGYDSSKDLVKELTSFIQSIK